MNSRFIFTSVTRISKLQARSFQTEALPKDQWAMGDYVATRISYPGSGARIELVNGRMMEPLKGEQLIGALGVRAATLEATGSWEVAKPGEEIHLLTGAGLIGKMTSISFFSPHPVHLQYLGHVMLKGKKSRMQDWLPYVVAKPFQTPVVLLVGTSMSAGKTTTGRIVTQQLKRLGLKVLGAKLTGAGRYRDILAIKDAGADEILDFVDAGLPSTVCPVDDYHTALDHLLSRMASAEVDVAVIEIGASPLEPYNGKEAIRRIWDNVRCKILCASDPYAVLGVMHGFDFTPDLVSGPATNTIAAVELVEKLCGVKAVNLLETENLPIMKQLLIDKLEISKNKEQ